MRKVVVLLSFSIWTLSISAQSGIVVSGSIQSDVLLPQEDDATGAEKTEDVLTNSYATLQLQSKYVDAGARLEYLEHPLPGFESDFKGWGVPHFYVKGKLGKAELTAGTFYEQFGSGFILRTYEERSLGIDNSLLGGRIIVKPSDGVVLKVLSGRQRRYWNWNKSWVSGADVEVNMENWIPTLQDKNTHLILGASWVNKYDNSDEEVFTDATHKVNFPQYVNAWDVRGTLQQGAWQFLTEYAQKTDDPSYDNGYIFRKGTTLMLSTTYSRSGLSVLMQAKRSENMSFKSTNDATKAMGISSSINHLPAFTQDHTYALAALYPYATQLADGEWAYQTELGYLFKKNTPLGGRYGMNVKLNFSYIRAIQRDFLHSVSHPSLSGTKELAGTDGYRSSFFKWGGDTYYQDFSIQLSRRLSRPFRLSLMYLNQHYNQTIVEGHGGMIRSNIFIADGKYQFSSKTTLRGELQYLTTAEDEGDWLFGLLELSLVPHWMVTISDMYNAGSSHLHYYQAFITSNWNAHRIQIGYGRTRAGYNCSGGVCRYIPAYKGLTLSYNYNF